MGWQLEVMKMCLYMAFPVGCFHYFNQPENFEEYVVTARRQMFNKESEANRAELQKFMEEQSRAESLKTIEAMEAIEEKKSKELKSKNNSQYLSMNQ